MPMPARSSPVIIDQLMSHRNDLNELTANVGMRPRWEDAVNDLHEAFQAVGIVLDQLEDRVKALEDGQAAQRPHE